MKEKTVFAVARDDLRRGDFIRSALDKPEPGEILLEVDSFAFTANNITYAELGETLRYWDFYPAPEGWGVVPVWGFADVAQSRSEGVMEGERLWGYWPMATHAALRPERVSESALVDGAAHRAKLPAVYNMYLRTAADPAYQARNEDLQALLRPLFGTSFLIDDLLAEAKFFGARMVAISSASSKTAFSLAHRLHRRGGEVVEVVGFTSSANMDFVKSLGCYDRVFEYEEILGLRKGPAVFVDIAGNGKVRTAMHEHLRDDLKYSCAVGLSHRDKHPPGSGLPGAKPVFFFAPEQGRKRQQDWGRDGFNARFADAWRSFLPFAEKSLQVSRGAGEGDVRRVYTETLEGKVAPDRGNILSLWSSRS